MPARECEREFHERFEEDHDECRGCVARRRSGCRSCGRREQPLGRQERSREHVDEQANGLNGGSFGFVGLAIVAGIVAIGVIALVNGNDDDNNSDSN